jgi:hypothetical protein
VAHDVFVNGVVNDLLEQDVTAVVRMRAVPMRPMYMPVRSRMCSSEDSVLILLSSYFCLVVSAIEIRGRKMKQKRPD